jgi:hypothetical protein
MFDTSDSATRKSLFNKTDLSELGYEDGGGGVHVAGSGLKPCPLASLVLTAIAFRYESQN